MKRVLSILAVTALLALSQSGVVSAQNSDEAALRELVRELANAIVHKDLDKLNALQDDFKGNAQGVGFNKQMLRAALQSKEMEVAAWTIDNVIVKVRGNAAVVTGRSTLSNAKYKGADFSGEWEWTDRFVKQRDGKWRLVASQAKIIKK